MSFEASCLALVGKVLQAFSIARFHILPDFDEGKRSCRRKLERHNKRRRRKSTDSRDVGEKETQVDHSIEDIPCDGETGKDNLCVSTNIIEETCLDYEDGPVSPFCLLPPSQNIGSISVNKVTSSIASGDTQMEGQNNSKCITSLFCDDKSAYSSACPTGRISFKLYDWNPAEFPRRLRHQIFQWLSSMPVELEGYIRPGCTILTIFISMPQLMWGKLSEDAVPYIHNLINAPESMLFERGSMVVNVNNMIYRVLKGGSCLTNVKMGVTAPRLHYVYPNYFEAGKPVEFIACGNNLLQPKFRFLVSFAGKYLAYDHCVSVYHGKTGSCYTDKEDTVQSCAHQLYKIYIPKTEPKLFGPAFVEAWKSLKSSKASFKTVADVGEPSIKARKGHQQNRGIPLQAFHSRRKSKSVRNLEKQLWVDVLCVELQGDNHYRRCWVENESGLSNFIPVLFGDRPICSEMQKMQQRFDKRASMSEILIDIAWLLEESKLEDILNLTTPMQIQRLNHLLSFLIENKFTVILERILQFRKILVVAENLHNSVFTKANDADIRLFEKYINQGRELAHLGLLRAGRLQSKSGNSVLLNNYSGNDMIYAVPSTIQDILMAKDVKQIIETAPLVNNEVVVNVNHVPQRPCRGIFQSTITCSRPFVLIVVASAALCFGVCATLLHPQKVGQFAISIRRCLFGNSNQ
ncbi:hypothetical protein GIB67_009866 [Kingdonia uniflora]|uniref:SBP-type domain-containing protein n=1 Tax=Kingdonia uniflora TaxID=39325 RepID=A0A7J7L7V8_9MAGN|nr:hypothetical protein GIB67_009866 [Kingdonia uniflora]